MRLAWPPRPLGLGTPLNLAACSRETRPLLGRGWWMAPVLGLVLALLVVGVDRVLVGGVTMQGIPDLGTHPSLGARVLISLFGTLFEELLFRVLLATLVAWLAYLALSRFLARPRMHAQWAGIVAGAIGSGVLHSGSGLAHVIALNVVTNAVYGWLYWRRGLELAILTHVVVTACLYIGVPALRP
jgi:membrane protease YdiL (CAAX protease family)